MHRAIGRVIRGTCRKWRENECPAAATEEVRNSKDDGKKKGFDPPKHTLEEAITWTTGIVVGYQLTQRRRRQTPFEKSSPACSDTSLLCSSSSSILEKQSKACPFQLSSRVFTQPLFNTGTALNVKSKSTSAVIQSIDVTPFIQDYNHESESELLDFDRERLTSVSENDDDDDIIFANESNECTATATDVNRDPTVEVEERISTTSSVTETESTLSAIGDPAEYGRRFAGDILSVLGAFEFLQAEANAKSQQSSSQQSSKGGSKKTRVSKKNGVFGKDPPIHAIDLLKKGEKLGSGRALYNLGVAYDRMKDIKLAKEYYKKAANVGHPLATYNCAVLALKEGHITEGYALMQAASEYGVPEANEFLNPPEETLAVQLMNLQVANTVKPYDGSHVTGNGS